MVVKAVALVPAASLVVALDVALAVANVLWVAVVRAPGAAAVVAVPAALLVEACDVAVAISDPVGLAVLLARVLLRVAEAVAAVESACARVARQLACAVAEALPLAPVRAERAAALGSAKDDELKHGRLVPGHRHVQRAARRLALCAAEVIHVSTHEKGVDRSGVLSIVIEAGRREFCVERQVHIGIATYWEEHHLHAFHRRRQVDMVVFVRVLVDKVHLPLVERELRRVELWHFGCVAAKRRARRANVAVVPEGRAAQVADQAPRPAARVGRVWVPAKVVTAETSVWPAFDRVRMLVWPLIGPVLARLAIGSRVHPASVVPATQSVVAFTARAILSVEITSFDVTQPITLAVADPTPCAAF
mmetsp:Transcript_31844/g.69683  ORF Transcript_31844/g.69683 Transcript_31844/m.69683 type:complete len:362 (+) Transcript_31844:279-1364(+)